jgi:hypothetical protein
LFWLFGRRSAEAHLDDHDSDELELPLHERAGLRPET